MTWAELIAQPIKPDTEVYLSIFPATHLVRQNFPVGAVRQEGQLVFLDGMEVEP